MTISTYATLRREILAYLSAGPSDEGGIDLLYRAADALQAADDAFQRTETHVCDADAAEQARLRALREAAISAIGEPDADYEIAKFARAARAALPGLLDALEAAERERDEAREHLRICRDSRRAILDRNAAEDAKTIDLLGEGVGHVGSLMRERDEALAQCASVLRQTGARIGVEPGAAVRALIADRDALALERDEALAKLGRVTTRRDRLRRAWASMGPPDNPTHTAPEEHGDCAVAARDGSACTCGLDAALKGEP